MKNSPDETITTSAVDPRSTMRNQLDNDMLLRGRRRVTIETTMESLRAELRMLDDADEVALAAMAALEARMAGLKPKDPSNA